MRINSDTILRIPLYQCAVLILIQKLNITISCDTDLRLDLLSDIRTINQSVKNFSEEQLVNVLLFGSENFTLDTNRNILRRKTEFLKATERCNGLLF